MKTGCWNNYNSVAPYCKGIFKKVCETSAK